MFIEVESPSQLEETDLKVLPEDISFKDQVGNHDSGSVTGVEDSPIDLVTVKEEGDNGYLAEAAEGDIVVKTECNPLGI